MKGYRYIFFVVLAIFSIQAVHVNKDKLFEIAKHIEIYTNIYKELNSNYVDELDPAELMKTGIDAMVNSLDPYTRYISESQIESFRISTEGKYSGIGAVIREVDSVLTLIEAYENSPAIEAGLIPGDQILSVNGESTKGRSSEDIRNIMRGAPGTDIAMVVKRYGEEDLKNFSVSRSEINIPNVPHYEILEGGYGYVHLSQFTDNSSLNIVNAIKEMKKEQELNGIILDLRFNGGGLLREAIGVTNIFVNKDEEIVSTKGKVLERDRIFKTTMSPLDTLSPVVVLINGRSASASEIVSGAIQDLDRGVLVGQRSFGKGLVQNTQKVGYNSQIKLTTSKYYIPSGRCIQSVAYENGEPVHIPDEERKAFKTKIGRKVLDGGGVKPDINVEKQEIPEFVQFLLKKNVIFKYANGFCAKHDSIAEVGSFHFEDYEGFKKMFNDMNLDFNSKLENSFLKFSEELESSGKTMVEDQLVQQIKGQLQQESAELLNKNKDLIINEIEKEIISRYYFLNGKIRYSLLNDVELETAIEILNNPIKYKEILSVIE